MTIVEQAIRDLLIQTNLTEQRVYLLRAPQHGAEGLRTPYMVFFHLAPQPLHAHGGPLSLLRRDYQVSIFDQSQTVALAIADSLREYLDGYHQTFEGVRFGSVFYRNQTSAREPDTALFQIIQVYRVQYTLLESFVAAVQNRSTIRSSHRS